MQVPKEYSGNEKKDVPVRNGVSGQPEPTLSINLNAGHVMLTMDKNDPKYGFKPGSVGISDSASSKVKDGQIKKVYIWFTYMDFVRMIQEAQEHKGFINEMLEREKARLFGVQGL